MGCLQPTCSAVQSRGRQIFATCISDVMHSSTYLAPHASEKITIVRRQHL